MTIYKKINIFLAYVDYSGQKVHTLFNGGWAVLLTLDSFIDSFEKKIGVNFQVFPGRAHAHPALLTT